MSYIPSQFSYGGLRQLASQNPALLFVLLYFVFQLFFLTTISNGAGVDDAEQLAYVGALQWGYGGSQPPLYTWINSVAGSLFGISLFTIYLVKFGMLASMFFSVYFGARLLGLSKLVAAAGMLGVFLLPQIAWESQRTLTHSVGGTTGCAWAFLAFAWHMKSRSWLSAALLGLGIAAGVLGKFNAAFFMIALVLAGLSIPAYRSVLLSRKSILTLLMFAMAVAPTGLWALGHTENLLARTHKFQMNEGDQFFSSRLHGVWKLLLNSILFTGVALVLFIASWWAGRDKRASPRQGWSDGETLISRILLFALALVLAGVIVSGAAQVKDRWLQPVLFLSPLFLSILLGRYTAEDLPLKRFAVVGAICALIVTPSLAVNILYARDGVAPAIGQLDYAKLFAATRAEGNYQTVVSNGPQLPGNLRLLDTSINPIHFEMPNAVSRIRFPALIVWFGHDMSPNLLSLLQGAGINQPADIRHIELSYKHYPDSTKEVSYFLVQAPH